MNCPACGNEEVKLIKKSKNGAHYECKDCAERFVREVPTMIRIINPPTRKFLILSHNQ